MSQVSTEVSAAPVVVSPVGAKVSDRKLDVVYGTTCGAVLTALVNQRGDVGKLARERMSVGGLVGLAEHAANGNYRPLAEYIAARTGEAVVISGRAMFEALPDVFEARIMNAKAAKNGGMRVDGKGIEVPNAKLALAMELKAVCVDAVATAAAVHAARKAKQEAEAAKQAQLPQE